ncbi:methyltransferase, FkbM family [Sphingomonas palmae]|uniref:Methyltransferase, FkbM family n=1 Tax=Sphingomonas palmae TaxID=1855283 RepID=A0A1H7UX95_9SPHN|nr:FkbM family methyltransferase [Sphingomonas palmae]SEM01127.1 methyltransferase, FkbM family [Sphingomonas palmae]
MNVVSAVRRRISPLHGFMTAADYRAAAKVAPFSRGQTRLQGQPIAFSDNVGFFHSVREVFGDEVYRFKAKTQTPYIIDAGANIGLSVRYFKNLYPQAKIVAFEPDPDIFILLEENVRNLDGVSLKRAAAWTENTDLTFYMEGSLAGSTQIDFLGSQREVRVPALRLRYFIQDGMVDFLKIDIEGAENSVLFDIADQLDRVDHLFFEYHSSPGQPQQLGDLLNLVAKAGYRYAINGAHCAGHPFVETVSKGFDTQLNVSCFRN